MAVLDWPPLSETRLTAFGRTSPAVGHSAERADQEDHVVAQLLRGRRVLHSAGATGLSSWSAVAVEQALQHRQPDLRRVVPVQLGDEFGVRAGAEQVQLAHYAGHRVLERDDVARGRAAL